MPQFVKYKRSQIIEVLRHLNGIVVSLDRIAAAHVDMKNELWKEAIVEYFLESEALKALANCRKFLSAPFSRELGPDDMEELEREMENLEYWSRKTFLERHPNS